MKQLMKGVILLFFFVPLIIAQEVFVCDSYTEDGTPVGPINRFEIKPYGTAKYILINNNKKFDDPILYLFLDKIINGQLIPYDSKTLNIEKKNKWVVTSYEFKEPGIYELYFLNPKQSRLGSVRVEVYFSEQFASKTFSPTKSYVGECQFIFCELVIDGKPINPFNSLSLSRSNRMSFIYLNNHFPFEVDKIKVQVWKKSQLNSSYEDLVDEKKYKLLPEWKDIFFRYYFKNTGEYKIDVFDVNNNFISSNIITITN